MLQWVRKLWKAIDDDLRKPAGIGIYDRDTNTELHRWEITGWQFLPVCTTLILILILVIRHC